MTRRADRLLLLLEQLRSRPVCTASELSAALEVSPRTIYRDIEALVGAGVPIRGEAGVGYILEAGYYLPPLNLTADEAEALALGARVLAIWSDGAVSAQAASALAKIRAVLQAGGQAAVDQDIFWAPKWVTRKAPAVDLLDLKRAAQDRRVLEIDYETLNGSRSTRTVRPLSVSFFGPVWLLIAWCERARDFRCFRLDRIRGLSTTGRRFRDEDGKRLADFKRAKGEQAALADLESGPHAS
jgi:predicted DNA-binding transcriptional regulator YafY